MQKKAREARRVPRGERALSLALGGKPSTERVAVAGAGHRQAVYHCVWFPIEQGGRALLIFYRLIKGVDDSKLTTTVWEGCALLFFSVFFRPLIAFSYVSYCLLPLNADSEISK